MGTIMAVIILLLAVVVANIIHLQWPVIPLALYQLLMGIILAYLPLGFDPGHLVTEPELFMMLVIAPLLFNEGQNQSFRTLRRHSHVILSVAVGLAITTVLIAGSVLHLINPVAFPLASLCHQWDSRHDHHGDGLFHPRDGYQPPFGDPQYLNQCYNF